MRLLTLSIQNYRCLEDFQLDPEGLSVFLIGENGTGKSTVLEATARVLGRGRTISREDFGTHVAR